MLYYFKNIDSLTPESTNFSLNDEEFSRIKKISDSISNHVLILFWQFTIKTLQELDIVSNQNLSIEMFLIRLIYLNSVNYKNETINNDENSLETIKSEEINNDTKSDPIDQIKEEYYSRKK